MSVYDCLDCGLATERHDVVETEVQDSLDPTVIREGEFAACAGCGSIDVDVYSPEGWEIEMRARDVEQRP